MIRGCAIATTLQLTLLMMVLPAAYPPSHFLVLVRTEHQHQSQFWGSRQAAAMLARTLEWQAALGHATLAPLQAPAPSAADPAMDQAVAASMAGAVDRLLRADYLRSLDALLLLALFRLAAFTAWFPLAGLGLAALLVDGWVTRAVRGREFVQPRPEHFALCGFAVFAMAAALLVLLVLPLTLPPWALGLPLTVACVALRGLVANYHRYR